MKYILFSVKQVNWQRAVCKLKKRLKFLLFWLFHARLVIFGDNHRKWLYR